jgi:dihydropyrimidinase
MFDLVVRGGMVVTTGAAGVADVGIEDGRIAALGRGFKGRREVAADGKYVLPGGVDVHVHFSPYLRPVPGLEIQVDDFYSGSLAAVAGGITTVGNMTHQWPEETLHGALARDLAAAKRDAAVDYILHPVLTYPTDDAVGEIADLAAQGHGTLKIFLVFDNFDANVGRFLEAMRVAGASGMVVLAHCEDSALIAHVQQTLLRDGRTAPRYYPDSRPDYTEAVATERAIAFSRATGAPIYIVHLSSSAALERCVAARAHGLPVYVETRPLYLHLTRERFADADGAKYTGNPPLREAADVKAIWDALANGSIQCLCTDHAPWTLKQKLDPSLDITTLRAGVSDLETMMPMLFSEGVLAGRLSLSRFVEVTSTNAAKLFGLFPQKGTIAVGSDADLVVWDPEISRTIDGAKMQSKSGYSVYDGSSARGWPTCTISRGEVVFDQGAITAERGRGRWLRSVRAPSSRVAL